MSTNPANVVLRNTAERSPAWSEVVKRSACGDQLKPAASVDAERELHIALRNNVAGAFHDLVHRYGDYLYRVALRLTGSEAEARDVVQDSFISALRHIAEFEGRSSLKTWLYRLTVNATFMRMRSKRRLREISMEDFAPPPDGPREEPEWNFVESVETSSSRSEVRALVRSCIDKLPDTYRIVLVLRDIEGHNTREVASLLSESEANVKVRLHRARAVLKKLLEPLYRSEAL